MARSFEHTNPRSRKPDEFKGTWKGRNYRRGVFRTLAVNLLIFCAIFGCAIYVVHVKDEARQNPRVWTLGSQ
ncbi:hypothetical protein [Ruegeria profundi]|uniref:hypothetical protein n=1 Tax=Ruegeria profundi TaxID=1685378 RepID=UPI001CD1F919|nr:hypothetical protein [Ruegeria profundi]MCA0930079.1 hypothetical protein [Ruegeria profundi]